MLSKRKGKQGHREEKINGKTKMTDKEQGGGEKPLLRKMQFPESCSIPGVMGEWLGRARA